VKVKRGTIPRLKYWEIIADNLSLFAMVMRVVRDGDQ